MFMTQITSTLQASVAPCLLISGFGFLLLTMTNRLGRGSDRVRLLINELAGAKEAERPFIKEQIRIIYERCRYLRSAIAMLVFGITLVAVNVLLLFLSLIFSINLNVIIEILFASSLVCVIVSLGLFLVDISLTLKTLKIELENLNEGII